MVTGYKGFDKDLKCRGFQYKVGEEYEEKEAIICNSGFHFCEFPLDVFRYYEPASNRFATVSTNEKVYGDNNDSKKCSRKIKINAEIGLPGIIKAGVEFIFNKVDWKNNKESNTGNWSAATNTGDQSAATTEGKESVSISLGIEGRAKGIKGSWIILSEWEEDSSYEWHRKTVKSFEIDGENIKENTFYILKNGTPAEFKE
jgi:hypothetical protein